jgi:hypothetical protein
MKSKLKRSVLLGILLSGMCCAIKVSAQKIPGYWGHRLSINYQFLGHPAILGEGSISGVDAGNGISPGASNKIAFVYSHSLSLDYVINRRASIGMSGQYFQLSGGVPTYVEYGTAPFIFNATGTVISIYIKRFHTRTGAIAPLGKYVKYELNRSYYSGINQNLSYYSPNGYYTGGNYNNGGTIPATTVAFNSGNHVGVSLTLGRTFILFNRIIIDRGIRFSSNLFGYYVFKGQLLNNSQNTDPAIGSGFENQYLNFFIGIGFMP